MLKIACSEDDFKTEFEKVSASISWLCLITKFIGVSKEKRKSNQLAVLNQMLEQNNVQYPHFSQLIFFFCVHCLFMFVSLKLPTRKLSEYEEEVKLLEGDLK